MQLGKKSALLTAATLTLLGIHADDASAKGEPNTVDVDAGFLYYGEANGRVKVYEPVLDITNNYDQDQHLSLHLVLDTLSGASPNGATPSNKAQTFTHPSGNSSEAQTYTQSSGGGQISTSSISPGSFYTIGPNQQPMDSSFKDTRVAATVNWTTPINRDWAYNVGGHGSTESDYSSIGVNGGLSRNLFEKNTVLNTGLALSYDSVSPHGGIPKSLSRMAMQSDPGFETNFNASRTGSTSDSKKLVDFLFGVTQILNESTLVQLNFTIGMSNGYLTDPYKIVSIIDNINSANYGGNYLGPYGNPYYLYEKRPDKRTKKAIYFQAKHSLDDGDIINLEYRYMHDDWGVKSQMVDLHYRFKMDDDYLQPHVRWYHQSQANFYQRYLTATDYQSGNLPNGNISADYRLGQLTDLTFGLKYGTKLGGTNDASVKLEYFKQVQTGDQGIGQLANQKLYPANSAIILQFGLSL
jgi:hypothetical protein